MTAINEMPGRRRGKPVGLIVVALVALVALWSTGRMDTFLVNFGLNHGDCIKNGFGATFCGADAKRYQQQVAAALSPSASVDGTAAASQPSAGEMQRIVLGEKLADVKLYLGEPDKVQRSVTQFGGIRNVDLYIYYGSWQLFFENGRLMSKANY